MSGLPADGGWTHVLVDYSELECRIVQKWRDVGSPPETLCIICWRAGQDVPALHFMRARHGEGGWIGHCEAHACRRSNGSLDGRYDPGRVAVNIVREVMER